MWIPDWILRIAGRKIADKIGLEEKMDSTKPWYQSKTIWTSIVSGIVGIYITLQTGGQVHLPPIPGWVLTILGAIGVYTRSTATDKIG